jgi:hypothetical protein
LQAYARAIDTNLSDEGKAMKTRFALLVTPFLLLFALACSDNPAASKLAAPRGASREVFPTGSLDDEIMRILALLPKGLETAATTRWGNIKAKYALGLSDPQQMAVARQMLFELSAWVKMKAPNMDAPPAGESRGAAASRAVLYMSLYVFNGLPHPLPPGYFSGADAVVGLVTPGAAATVVTPSAHAGVAFEAGSVAENTIVLISQNLSGEFTPNCTGPLHTLLCQYPQFYTFEEFPHTRLLKGAKFSVCHINGGSNRAPLGEGIHDRFRLAHDKPANPADYTPGSTIRDQNGESIEILPLISQTFTHCNDVEYTPEAPPEEIGLLSRMGRALASLMTPKSAYAIDQGGGGVSFFFSNFNDVDSVGRPDRAVQSFTAVPLCGDCSIQVGTVMVLNYTIANIGFAATGDGVPGLIELVPVGGGTPSLIGSFGVGQLYPGGPPFVMTDQHVTIPDVPAGDYTIRLTVGIGFFNEVPANLTNNSASIPVTISSD